VDVIEHWIDGKSAPGIGDRRAVVMNPATGEPQSEVALAAVADVDRAVDSAAAAWPAWRDTSLARRADVLFGFREQLKARADDVARIISSEHGKTHEDALGEVTRGLEVVEFACGAPHLLKGDFSENVATDVDSYSIRQPLGVVAGITPFNFPAMVPMWMFPLALATGNAFVLKPSEKDPSASLLLADLLHDAGLPAGLFNVVQGDRVAVARLLEHPAIEAVSFVGSTPVAQHVYATAAANGKRVQALGGAKNHMVVLPDADLDAAADAAVSAAYGSAGERCMAVSAVVAVGNVGDRLVDAIRARARSVVVGPAADLGSEMGPLITAEHLERVVAYLDRSRDEGARVVVDGREHDLPEGDGFWLGPCLVADVSPDMAVYRDEIFGPVLAVLRAEDLNAAIELINANPYGNGTAIFTADGGAARTFQNRIQVGMVGINVPIPVPVGYHSFGGWKASLFGDSHIYGPDGIRFYTRAKAVTARWRDRSGVRLGFPESA
jgi:malonate-semialdehyde dehydrogenase (acetylating) / methylmalonate-semialdehyde dehydrogenase